MRVQEVLSWNATFLLIFKILNISVLENSILIKGQRLWNQPITLFTMDFKDSDCRCRLIGHRQRSYCSPQACSCSQRYSLTQKGMARPRHLRGLGMCITAVLASFIAGFTVGWFIKPLKETTTSAGYHQSIQQKLLSEMKAENIRSFLRSFTKLPHLAGTEQNLLLAKKIQTQWKKFGLDSANLVHYDVLLSYPNETNANYVSIVDEHGVEIFKTSYLEPPPDGYENVTNIIPPYNAFSASGMPEGELVYVNYARTEDFFKLEREMNINCTGKIVIARYGKIFRGNKPYPKGWNLPGAAAQRGNVLNLNGAGDPLTPGYPAKGTESS